MARPTGVTIIAVLYFIGAAICLLVGILMFVGGGLIATMMNQGGDGAGAGAGILAGLGALAGVVVLVLGVISALLGWGLLKLKNWARIIVIVFAGLGILGALAMLLHFSPIILVGFIIRLAINGLILWYLLKPEVAAAFQN